uniref:ULP_PROTEASE domain-containing protein n=1 Tax=Mesocestoides corti TaxID=53468 RepID=A0A5K3FQH9_MESCO
MITQLAQVFNKSYHPIWHVIGDMETAVRDQYTASFMADLALSVGKTEYSSRCCGNLYYTTLIGPQWRLVVLDGYELLAVEPKNTFEAPTLENSETTGDGFIMQIKIRDPTGKPCVLHDSGPTKRVGWPKELMTTGDFMTACERGRIPRVRLAMSRTQLTWLTHVLRSAMHCNENVIVACKCRSPAS